MLLQAIPVLHFFTAKEAVFYTYVDEEKPEQKSKVGKDDFNQEFTVSSHSFTEEVSTRFFGPFIQNHHLSPLLEFLTPPPDAS